MRNEPEPQAGSRILQLGRPAWGVLPSSKFADGLLDDVVHDVGGRVIDAAGLLDFGLVLDHRAVAFGQADDLAEELLIDLAEDVGRRGRRTRRGCRGSRGREDVAQELVVDVEGQGEFVGGFVAALLRLKWKRPEL